MRRYTAIFILLIFYLSLWGQKKEFTIIEDMPMFQNGGTDKFQEYIHETIKYTEEALILDVEGKVYVKFLINFSDSLTQGKGKVDSVQIVKSLHPLLDTIALNVVKTSPLWTSGKSRGTPQNIWVTMPFNFTSPSKYYNSSTDKNERNNWGIHQVLLKNLIHLSEIAPESYDNCDIYFKINKNGYILDYHILNCEHECFYDFVDLFVISLPSLAIDDFKFISSNTWLKVSVISDSSGISLSKISISDTSQLHLNQDRPLTKEICFAPFIFNNEIPKTDSIHMETEIEDNRNMIHTAHLYTLYPNYNIEKETITEYKNNKQMITKTVFSKTITTGQNQLTTMCLIKEGASCNTGIKKIHRRFLKQKKAIRKFTFTKKVTTIDKIHDTLIIYNSNSELNKKIGWIDKWNSYSKKVNNQLVEEGFQITSGMETAIGDNQDSYIYYNNGMQFICMSKRNEGVYTEVYFVENSKRFTYKIENIYDNFKTLFSAKISRQDFETYLIKNKLEYYPKIQFFDASNNLVKEKFLAKRYGGAMQHERIKVYKNTLANTGNCCTTPKN